MVGDIYKLTANSALYGSRIANVFHYKVASDATSGTNESDLIERFRTLVLPDWMAIVSSDFLVDCLSAQKVGVGVNPPTLEVLSSGNVGTVVEESLPPNKNYLLSQQTATFTKRGRGRKFLAGVPESWEDDNCIDASHRTALITCGTSMSSDLSGGPGGGDYDASIYSQVAGTAQKIRHFDFQPQVHSLRGRTAVRC